MTKTFSFKLLGHGHSDQFILCLVLTRGLTEMTEKLIKTQTKPFPPKNQKHQLYLRFSEDLTTNEKHS